MHFDDSLVNALEAESSKTPNIPKGTGELSAWSTDIKLDIINRKISTAAGYSPGKPSPKFDKRYTKMIQPKVIREKPTEFMEERRYYGHQRNTPTFTAYLNSLINKNSQILKKNEKILDKQKKLEIVSVKIHTATPGKRFNSYSPDKLNKLKLPKFLEESFLIHQRMPPSVSGYTMTVYPKTKNTRGKSTFYVSEYE